MREVRGHEIVPSAVPPEITVAPWYSVVAVDLINAASAGTVYQIADIAKYACQQHGWEASGGALVPLFIKVHTIKCWATSAVSTASIALECFDYCSRSSASAVLFRSHSSAGKATWASVGYHWPTAQTDQVFDNKDTFNVARVVTSSSATVHFSVSIRGSQARDLPERLRLLALD